MVATAEKVDPAHWVSIAGGGLMNFVLIGTVSALLLPWWTDEMIKPGHQSAVKIGLWIRYTRYEMAADSSAINCEAQCDITKVGSAKVRESETPWADVCDEATGDTATLCMKLWVVRIAVLFCWFLGLMYIAVAFLNFCGAGLPASTRIAPATKVALGAACIVMALMALCMAFWMEVRLEAKPPGTEPKRPTNYVPRVELNGYGFYCMVGSFFFSGLGTGMAYLAQRVLNTLEENADMERGKPLADVNQGEPPHLHHQSTSANLHLEDVTDNDLEPSKPVKKEKVKGRQFKRIGPPPAKMGTWMA